MTQFGAQATSMDQALAWARGSGTYVPAKGALAAINAARAARADAGLPRFVLRDAEPLPEPAREPLGPVQAPTVAEHIPQAAVGPSRAGMTAGEVATFSREIRRTLLDEVADLRSGVATPQRAQAVAKLVQQAIAAVRVEMDFCQQLASPRMREIEG